MTITSPTSTVPSFDSIDIVDGTLYVRDFVETDAEVVRVVSEADDPVESTRQCLRIGARAISAVSVSVDTHIVEKHFDAMSVQIEAQIDQAVARIAEVTESLVGEDGGALTTALDAHRHGLDTLLGDTFDPDSKRSVIAIFEQVIAATHKDQAETVRKLVSIDDEDGPLAKLKRELVRDSADRNNELRKDLQELSERVAVKEAIAPVIAITTAKGFTFEDVVHDAVGRIAARHGDLADKVGTELGSAGTQKGDEVVTLSREDTFGIEGCFVLEAKARKLNSRKTNEELDAALVNRDAQAAIAVFASQDQAPTSVPFHYTDNKAIVVFDADGNDDAALRLSYMWARWVVRRELAGSDSEGFDLDRVTALLGEASRGLERLTQIKKFHTQAKNSITQAQDHAISMVTEVRDALDQLEQELG